MNPEDSRNHPNNGPHAMERPSYGTDPSTQTTEPTDSDVINQKTSPIIFKRRWSGFTEIVFNVLGTLGFVVGSLIWCLGDPTPGTLIFAASCVCCGISCTIYTFRFYFSDNFIGAYALVQQCIGCAIFTICSVLFLYPDFNTVSLIGFFAASLLFLTGCILTQVQCRSWLGILAAIYPGSIQIIPTSLFNTLGSVLFVLGSIFLFYPWGQDAGAWIYEIGSIIFFLASWGDATIWWKLGFTQSEHQQTSLENDYSSVKFL